MGRSLLGLNITEKFDIFRAMKTLLALLLLIPSLSWGNNIDTIHKFCSETARLLTNSISKRNHFLQKIMDKDYSWEDELKEADNEVLKFSTMFNNICKDIETENRIIGYEMDYQKFYENK